MLPEADIWAAARAEFTAPCSKTHSAGRLARQQDAGGFVEYVNAADFARLSKSLMEISDHIVVLTAIVGAIVTTATVDYERLEDCVNFAAKRYRTGKRPAFLERSRAGPRVPAKLMTNTTSGAPNTRASRTRRATKSV